MVCEGYLQGYSPREGYPFNKGARLTQCGSQLHCAAAECSVLLQERKREWFGYWDEDHSESLEKDELVRALVHTFGLGKDYDKLSALRGTLDAMWCIFDEDGCPTPTPTLKDVSLPNPNPGGCRHACWC